MGMGETDGTIVENLRKYAIEKGYDDGVVTISFAQPDGSAGITIAGQWYHLTNDSRFVDERGIIIATIAESLEIEYKNNHFPYLSQKFHTVVLDLDAGKRAVDLIVEADQLYGELEKTLISERKEHVRSLISKLQEKRKTEQNQGKLDL